MLSVIFLVLLSGSIQSVIADHLEPGKGIFKNETSSSVIPIQDSNYQIYLQTVLRNGDGQLISVSEGTSVYGYVISHKITDHVFDTLMGEKEIVTIDDIKYEKVQYTFSPTLEQRTENVYPIFEEILIEFDVDEDALAQMKEDVRDYYSWKIHYCATFEGHGYVCLPVFLSFTVVQLVTSTDVVTHQWTILRVLN